MFFYIRQHLRRTAGIVSVAFTLSFYLTACTEVVVPSNTTEIEVAPTATSTPEGESASTILLPQLVVAAVPAAIPEYDRDSWNHWIDADRDCEDTRAEVLIAESRVAALFADNNPCRVVEGEWLDPFTGEIFTLASDVDIDHIVPLANAHRSGAWAWSDQQKEDYANDLTFAGHLMAVDKTSNRSKGDRGPEAWLPPNTNHHCDYAINWITIKSNWSLAARQSEWDELLDLLGTCPVPIVVGDDSDPVDSPGNPSGGVFGAVSAGTIVITEVMVDPNAVRDSDGEWFEVFNTSADFSVSLEGWTLRDLGSDFHVVTSSPGIIIEPLGFAVFGRNADMDSNGGVALEYEYSGIQFANSGDEIHLLDVTGTLIDVFEYRSSSVNAGASMNLDPELLNADANDRQSSWCVSTIALPSGDFGTPGTDNARCP